MGDSAREHLDTVISRSIRDEKLLRHLAETIGSSRRRRDVHADDMIDALERAADLTAAHRSNLEYVRAVYDAKVNGEPV